MPLTDEKMSHLQSLYAGKHKAFLHQNHPKAYVEMEKAGTLEAYLQRIGEQAASLYETIIDQMTEQPGDLRNLSSAKPIGHSVQIGLDFLLKSVSVLGCWLACDRSL